MDGLFKFVITRSTLVYSDTYIVNMLQYILALK